MGKRVNFLLDPSHLIPTSQWRNSGKDLKIETFLETVTAHNTDRHFNQQLSRGMWRSHRTPRGKRIRMEISEVNRHLLNGEFSSNRQPSLHRMSKDVSMPHDTFTPP
jgi:DNA-directed RNA polymerase beta' subunit